jgi:hypothetical protein
MGTKSKSFALILIFITAFSSLSLLMLKPVSAQSIPKPSVPEFTLQFVGSPYNALVVTVKNQPYDSAFGTMYYNLRLKNHNAGNDGWIYPLDRLFYSYHTYPEQSTDSEYTNISITVQSNFLLLGIQNDIEIEAMLGTIGRDAHYNPAPYVFNGQTSDWSNPQTITLPAMSTTTPTITPSTTPDSTNSLPNSSTYLLITSITLIVIAFLLAIIIALLLYRRHRKTLSQNKPNV